jgi:hypothetical protein
MLHFFDTYTQDSSISSPGSCHHSISQPVITWYCRSNGKSQEIEWKGNLNTNAIEINFLALLTISG